MLAWLPLIIRAACVGWEVPQAKKPAAPPVTANAIQILRMNASVYCSASLDYAASAARPSLPLLFGCLAARSRPQGGTRLFHSFVKIVRKRPIFMNLLM